MDINDYKGGVVFRTKYVLPNDQLFQGYIDYINRSEAQRNNAYNLYSAYAEEYMDDPLKQQSDNQPERTSALFTENKDNLSAAEKNELKSKFEEAQKNQSVLWQPLFSFKREFLIEYGILDAKTGFLDESRLRDVTRIAMKELLKSEGLEESALWTASIHYNTKHIHIHTAIVEPNPTREIFKTTKDGHIERKGKFKKNTIEKTKSKFVNTLVDRSKSHQRINDIVRNNLVAGIKATPLYKDKAFKLSFLELYHSLPDDKRKWQYRMNALKKDIRPKIDAVTNNFIETYCKEKFNSLCKELDDEVKFQNKAYGGNHTEYKKNELDDMYARMGNALLKQIKDYDRLLNAKKHIKRSNLSQKQKLQKYNQLIKEKKGNKKHKSQALSCLDSMMWDLIIVMQSEMHTNKNQKAYQQLMEKIDMEGIEQE